jgi:hypothetical protein
MGAIKARPDDRLRRNLPSQRGNGRAPLSRMMTSTGQGEKDHATF